ncbi:MAG TPA: hypothetical protein VHG08_11695 [Longimicrobium sp.]|nr:hypothetical protein [Longimicrobium sp.]
MTKRSRLNLLLLAVVAGGAPIALAPSPAMAGLGDGEGGTCCAAEAGSCYTMVDGVIVRQDGAIYKESGGCSAE